MSPEQLTSTPTKQDLLQEEIQKIGYEDIFTGPNNEKTFDEILLRE